MKLYSDILTDVDVFEAFNNARNLHNQVIWSVDVRSFKPRSQYANGVEFFAEGNSPHATGHRVIGSYPLGSVSRAATWSAYGYVIAALYQKDESAKIGFYKSKQDFILSCMSQWSHRQQYKRETIDFLKLVGVDY